MHNEFLLPALFCLLLPAVFSDLATRTIPNWLALAGLAGGGWLAWLQDGRLGLGAALLALLIAFGLSFPFWLCGWLGAGDVKLLAAVGALAGPALTPRILLFTAFSGLVLALVVMLASGRSRATWQRLRLMLGLAAVLQNPAEVMPDAEADSPRLPYALAIAAGSALALLQAGVGLPA